MNPHNNPNFIRGRPYNPNFNNQNTRSRDLHRWTNLNPNPSYMHAPNPNFTQPLMPQNGPLNATQMRALLQRNPYNHLQTQNLYAGFNQGAIPYTGPPPNQMMQFAQNQIFYGNQATGVQNAQFAQNQIFPANQMMSHLGVGSVPAIMGQNEGYQYTNAVVKQINHNGNRTSAKTPQILGNERSRDRFQNFQTTRSLNPRGRRGGGRGQHNVAVQGPSSMNLSEKGSSTSKRCIKDTPANVQLRIEESKKNVPIGANIEEKKAEKRRNVEGADAKSLSDLPTKRAKTSEQPWPRKSLHRLKEMLQEKAKKMSVESVEAARRQIEIFEKKQAAKKARACSSYKKEPSLLQKLLSKDIRRDKLRLLQAFRFMVANGFFKDWPVKPVVFPNVVLKRFHFAKVGKFRIPEESEYDPYQGGEYDFAEEEDDPYADGEYDSFEGEHDFEEYLEEWRSHLGEEGI